MLVFAQNNATSVGISVHRLPNAVVSQTWTTEVVSDYFQKLGDYHGKTLLSDMPPSTTEVQLILHNTKFHSKFTTIFY